MIATKLANRVEWMEDDTWHVGHIIVSSLMGVEAQIKYGPWRIMVLPYGSTLPVFVEIGRLIDRPSYDVLENA